VVSSSSSSSFTTKTLLRSIKNRITMGLSRFKDGWKVAHQHISAPVTSENLTAMMDL
jgi:ketosteroid isomerase-like protein